MEITNLPLSIEDQLILSTLCYVNYGAFVSPDEKITIGEASHRVEMAEFDIENFRCRRDYDLVKAIQEAPRFADLYMSDIREFFEDSRQFFAMTVHLPKEKLIVYRGTDLSLEGWKEDFEMAYEDVVPSQKDALEYLMDISKKYRGKLSITGHSKGGNLAVYAAANASPRVRGRINRVYNNDGPGFHEDSPTHHLIPLIEDKVTTIVPASSIIGLLMEHTEDYLIVESNSTMIFQHDPYSWVFDGPHFMWSDSRNSDSFFMDRVAADWLRGMSKEAREQFIDTLFALFGAVGLDSFRGLTKNVIFRFPEFIRAFRKLPKESRLQFKSVIDALFHIANQTLFHGSEKEDEPDDCPLLESDGTIRP